jgi:hypothetical protein
VISPAKTADWSSHLPTNVVVLPAINGEFDQQEGGEDHSADVEAIAPSNKQLARSDGWCLSLPYSLGPH